MAENSVDSVGIYPNMLRCRQDNARQKMLRHLPCAALANFEEKIVPSEKLGRGWYWHKYNDGSGYLESPDGKEYMSYDLDTNEYKETNDSQYEFFPLSYYYADGINPSEFKPFEYMENEMIEVILPKEKKMKSFV